MDVPRHRSARERARQEISEEILAAALERLERDGAAELSLRAVARDLGMVSSALFRYFPTRAAVLDELARRARDEVDGRVGDAAAAVRLGTVDERWQAVAATVHTWALAHPSRWDLVLDGPWPARGIAGWMGAALADLMDRGAYRPGPTPPPAVAGAVVPLVAAMPAGIPTELAVRGLTLWTAVLGGVQAQVVAGSSSETGRELLAHQVALLTRGLGLSEETADGVT